MRFRRVGLLLDMLIQLLDLVDSRILALLACLAGLLNRLETPQQLGLGGVRRQLVQRVLTECLLIENSLAGL